MKNTINRRKFVTSVGSMAGGITVLGPALANSLMATPPQVEGPFYPPEPVETDIDLTMLDGHEQSATGEIILVEGRVTNTSGQPLAGVRLDVWQANNNGRYDHPDDPNPAPLDPHFQGIGIMHTDEGGKYRFKTIKPAPYELKYLGDPGWRARHIHFKAAHEHAEGLTTQMYFEGDPLLEQDEDYLKAPEDQRPLLLTSAVADPETGLPVHRFDITLA
jgi:protocatechuate 3,4-dioxygenase beta subunit